MSKLSSSCVQPQLYYSRPHVALRKCMWFCFSWRCLFSWSYLFLWFRYEFLCRITRLHNYKLISWFSQHEQKSVHFSRSKFPCWKRTRTAQESPKHTQQHTGTHFARHWNTWWIMKVGKFLGSLTCLAWSVFHSFSLLLFLRIEYLERGGNFKILWITEFFTKDTWYYKVRHLIFN